MKDIIVMCPTVKRARYEFDKFCHRFDSVIEKKKLYEVSLINGQKIMFRGETEGSRVLRGTYADVITIDEFLILKYLKVKGDKNDE